jgi:hypothetical protein
MPEQMTWLEVEEIIDDFSKRLDELNLVENLTRPDPPAYIDAIRHLREAHRRLAEACEPCLDDCEDANCIGRPEHQRLVHETELPAVVKELEKLVERARAAVVDATYRTANCGCPDCLRRRMASNAPLN